MHETTSAQLTTTRWHRRDAKAALTVRPSNVARFVLWPVLAMWVGIGDRLGSALTTVGRAIQRSARPFGI